MDKQRIEDILRVFEDCLFSIAKNGWVEIDGIRGKLTDEDRIEFIVGSWEDAKDDLYCIGIEVE